MSQTKANLPLLISAFARAYHSKYDTPVIFNDSLAGKLITDEEYEAISEQMVQGIRYFNPEIAAKYNGQPDELLKYITQVQLAPTTLSRSAYCEKVLKHECMLGASQYVILGAGFDTFSIREREAQSIDIFEVDRPAVQELKRDRLNKANLPVPSHLHFIPRDFENEFSPEGLIQEGFKKVKTFFSLLGVSYYLTEDALKELLIELFSLVPEGSSIVFDYADANTWDGHGVANRVEKFVQLAQASGEPIKSCYTYRTIERLVEEAGLLVYEHLTPEMIDEQFFGERDDYLSAFETIHFIHAVKK